MVSNAGALFAAPRIVAGPGGPRDVPGTVLLRSADPLGGYPVTVVHSLRTWADADPGHPLAAERGPDGAWQSCSYGAAVAAAAASARRCSTAAWARTARCSSCPATVCPTCWSRWVR